MGFLANIRNDYNLQALEEKDLKSSPIEMANDWLNLAIEKKVYEPTAMTLSTVSAEGQPSSRVVLLKGIEEEGFVFYTNYESQKGKEIAQRPNVALLLFWKELERQIRIEGVCHKIEEQRSDEYFLSRPLGSRIGAIVSPQSQVIPSRHYLEAKIKELEALPEELIKRPTHWGGYVVRPHKVEFWQGRSSRLHDRFVYQQQESQWVISRIAP
ncbi:MAG: pyridoxamine 5'-phosphate oxidase [Cytophagaceae bacterium]|jgi:pyridoxamine 5'-phosphate oxidase|nr:pyridoxamine 5'-phosphate oxidase [Cytophagaceae bacterium]